MINSKELRIGNAVKLIASNDPEVMMFPDAIFIISAKGILEVFEGNMLVEPISLTPEILESYGFEITDLDGYNKGLYHEDLNCGLYGTTDSGYTFISFDGEDFSFEYIIKHLHQLQNVYFALTGKELNINL